MPQRIATAFQQLGEHLAIRAPVAAPSASGRWWLWCVPALLLAAGLRLTLLWQWPEALFWPDSDDSLSTAAHQVTHGVWKMHTKKTWLSPVIYTGLAYLPGGILRWTAAVQHALGLLCILFAGGLCFHWFKHWRVVILPLTLLIAAHPTLLVWEHAIMQESWFVTALLGVAWCVARFIRQPSWLNFGWLALSLFLCSGARPEGKLVAAAGFLVVPIALWRQWKPMATALALMAALALVIKKTTVTGQAGLLLLTSVIPFLPEELPGYPGLAEKLRPIQKQFLNPETVRKRFPKANTRNEISEAIHEWLQEQKGPQKKKNKREVDNTCLRVAKVICLKRAHLMPGWAWDKFRYMAAVPTAPEWTDKSLRRDQIRAFAGDSDTAWALKERLFGKNTPTYETVGDWVRTHVAAPSNHHWLHRWQEWWKEKPLAWHAPAASPKDLPGVPWFKLLAMAGMVVSLLGVTTRHRAQWAFLPVLTGLAFAVLLTCNIKARFLFFLDPFWLLYLAVLIESLALGGHFLWTRGRRPAAA